MFLFYFIFIYLFLRWKFSVLGEDMEKRGTCAHGRWRYTPVWGELTSQAIVLAPVDQAAAQLALYSIGTVARISIRVTVLPEAASGVRKLAAT